MPRGKLHDIMEQVNKKNAVHKTRAVIGASSAKVPKNQLHELNGTSEKGRW